MLQRAFGNAVGWMPAYRDAVRCLDRAIKLAPNDSRLYFWRGTLYWRELREPAAAETDLSHALVLAPRLARAYLNRAFARLEKVPPDQAGVVQDLKAFLQLDQDPYWTEVAEERLKELEARSRGPEDGNQKTEPQL